MVQNILFVTLSNRTTITLENIGLITVQVIGLGNRNGVFRIIYLPSEYLTWYQWCFTWSFHAYHFREVSPINLQYTFQCLQQWNPNKTRYLFQNIRKTSTESHSNSILKIKTTIKKYYQDKKIYPSMIGIKENHTMRWFILCFLGRIFLQRVTPTYFHFQHTALILNQRLVWLSISIE